MKHEEAETPVTSRGKTSFEPMQEETIIVDPKKLDQLASNIINEPAIQQRVLQKRNNTYKKKT